MKTVEVYLTDEEFEQARTNRLKWLQVLAGYHVEVGDLLLVQTFVRDANADDIKVIARQVTHVAPSVHFFGGDVSVRFDICSVSETFHTDLP